MNRRRRYSSVGSLLSRFTDTFAGNSLEDHWDNNEGDAAVINDTTIIPYSGVAGVPYNQIGSTEDLRAIRQTAYWEWTFPTAPVEEGIQQFFHLTAADDATDEILYGRFGVNLGFLTFVNGVDAGAGFVAWSDANHRWCRIRFTETTAFFEASADGETWSDPFSGSGDIALPAMNYEAMRISFRNGAFSGTGGGNMVIHGINH